MNYIVDVYWSWLTFQLSHIISCFNSSLLFFHLPSLCIIFSKFSIIVYSK